MEFLFIACNAN